MQPLAEVKHSLEELHKRSHFTNLAYIPAEANRAKRTTPFNEWFKAIEDENLKKCIEEQISYNQKILNQL